MNLSLFLFAVYLFLAIYSAGSMTVLQLQHYAIYPKVGREAFKDYIQSNNTAAIVPAILPTLLLLISTIALLFVHSEYIPSSLVVASLLLNLVTVLSTAIWQGRIHGQLGKEGFNEALIQRLINTNWIRTIALFLEAIIAVFAVVRALK